MRKLEVIVLNAQDSVDAYSAGADRLELVSHMEHGGLSPEISIVREVVNSVPIPVNVMVRFKHEDFTYNSEQMQELVDYVKDIRDLDINGIVFGSLDLSGNIDMQQLNEVLKVAQGLDFTFHRAIDENQSKYENNFKKIDGLVTTVLTSGGLENPIDENIQLLNRVANGATRVLVGGGINASNYKQVVNNLPNCDFHIGSLAYNEGDFSRGINSEAIVEFKNILSTQN